MSDDPAEVRASRLLRDAGISRYPIPVEEVARHLGAVVSLQPFDSEDISGLLYRSAGNAPIIGVNSTNIAVRRRFTIAHEIGHLILHGGHELIVERHVHVNFRDSAGTVLSPAQEVEANRFAAALLMPGVLLERAMQTLLAGAPAPDTELVKRLALRFDVSRQAMEFRLAGLGMLTPS